MTNGPYFCGSWGSISCLLDGPDRGHMDVKFKVSRMHYFYLELRFSAFVAMERRDVSFAEQLDFFRNLTPIRPSTPSVVA